MNKREIFDVVHEYKKLKDRITKAIEYIEKHCKTNPHLSALLVDSEIIELLEILKGEDNG